MSERATIRRPGLAQGELPERRVERVGWLDRKAAAFASPRLGKRAAERMHRVPALVKAFDAALERASDMEIEGATQVLRQRLAVEGLTQKLIVRSFAIIREVARRKLGTPHYDVQLMGGWLMANGMLAEMQTGEGKTLTTTLPVSTAALAGIPVHVISANDYLVSRDAELMRPVYEALGLSVASVTQELKDTDARRAAYACDIVYASANTFAFDYLRDRMASGGQRGLTRQLAQLEDESRGEPLLRGLCFAVVDEADSVLIDEAKTPLILSRQADVTQEKKLYKRALRIARALDSGSDFEVNATRGQVALTEAGCERLAELTAALGGVWSGPRRSEEWTLKALSALHVYQRDQHYIVREDKVQIVDALTGRVSADRSWEGGLHQMIELKEGVPLTAPNETLARISYQQFFRRYLTLAGTTGTASEVARELGATYGLHTAVVPPRKPIQRVCCGERVFVGDEAKWEAVVERIQEMRAAGRPTLVGTWSVEASEQLGKRLKEAGIPHQVLNARQDADEAAIVERAGVAGGVLVATNMAGRGTDIPLGPGVEEAGGLHVIATQRGDASRVDRQLYGRSGRQGNAGSYETIASLEDSPQIEHFSPLVRRLVRGVSRGAEVPHWLVSRLLSAPQRAEEKRHAAARQSLVQLEEYLDQVLAFTGTRE